MPDETMLSRSRSRALDALYNAQVAATSRQCSASSQSFEQIMNACGKVFLSSPAIWTSRAVSFPLSCTEECWRRSENGSSRLLVGALAISRDAFNEALQSSFAAPRIGHAKADGAPTIIPRSYEELIRASSMTDERKRYWLSED